MNRSVLEGVPDTSEEPRNWSDFCVDQVEASAPAAAVLHNIEPGEQAAGGIPAEVVLVDSLMELVGQLVSVAPDIVAPLAVRIVESELAHNSPWDIADLGGNNGR